MTLCVVGTGPDGVLDRAFDRYCTGRESDRLFHNTSRSAVRCDSNGLPGRTSLSAYGYS